MKKSTKTVKDSKKDNDNDDKILKKEEIVVEETKSIITNTNVHSPYIDTTLVCPIMLYPNQMDNKI